MSQERAATDAAGTGTDPGSGTASLPTGADEENGLVAPTKAHRLMVALSRMTDELDQVSPDDTCREHLVEAHRASLIEIASTVSDVLMEEMVKLRLEPLAPDASTDQIRIAQAQLLGWVSGLLESGGAIDGETLAADGQPVQVMVIEDERG